MYIMDFIIIFLKYKSKKMLESTQFAKLCHYSFIDLIYFEFYLKRIFFIKFIIFEDDFHLLTLKKCY